MRFNINSFQKMYHGMITELGDPITLKIMGPSGVYIEHTARAVVSAYKQEDLLDGGSLRLGDKKAIILADALPLGLTMERVDMIEHRGEDYSVIQWDADSRHTGGEQLAFLAVIRG